MSDLLIAANARNNRDSSARVSVALDDGAADTGPIRSPVELERVMASIMVSQIMSPRAAPAAATHAAPPLMAPFTRDGLPQMHTRSSLSKRQCGF